MLHFRNVDLRHIIYSQIFRFPPESSQTFNFGCRSKVFPEQNLLNYTKREPIGVAGLISPWNLPLYLLTFKLAPALICGNTVVAKPSELTSVTAFMLCKLFEEAGKFALHRVVLDIVDFIKCN